MANYQKIKGTQDFFGTEILKLRYIEKVASNIANNFGFNEIKTPIFENTEVFVRLGDESDIVTKEMYTFLDKGNRSITLRPEGTAAVVRSYLENKLYANNLPLTKLYYFGPMFRYERPQAGRYREFHQFGVEVFGKSTALLDCDVIISAYQILKKLKIDNFVLKINSIGDYESRKLYSDTLQSYFKEHLNDLCDDCKRRIEKNPLRILDCKVDNNNPILLNAPKIHDFLNQSSKQYFQEVLSILNQFNIPYEVDEKLVRGLDYYTDTVFEFIINSQDDLNGIAICGGGKYAELVKSFNGMDIPGIGYAMGVERLIAIMDIQNKWDGLINNDLDVLIISLDYESKLKALEIAHLLRDHNFKTEIDYENITMKQQFKLADKLNPKFIMIIGEEERQNGVVSIKDSRTKTQESVANRDIITYLKGKLI